MDDLKLRKTFLWSVIISLSISGLIGIIVFLFGTFGEVELRLLLTTLAIACFSLTGLCCAALYERHTFPTFSAVGMVISSLAFLVSVLLIWDFFDTEGLWKLGLVLIILAFSFAHASLLLLATSSNLTVKRLLFATLAAISIVSLMLIYLVLEPSIDYGGFYYRFLGVFAILDVLGSILTPIVKKMHT